MVGSSSSLIIQAAGFAKAAHEGQFRNTLLSGSDVEVPYIVHVSRVAGLTCTLPDVTEEMVAAAWLHDVIEDCGVKHNLIRYLFGETVCNYTIGLTSWAKREENKIDAENLTRPARINANNLQTATECIEVRRIKLCDRTDNMTDTLIEASPDFALRYVLETEHLMYCALNNLPDKEMYARLERICKAIKNKYRKPND